MEAVQLFNQEMASLYGVKPPISKAKMTSITKGAIRAIKYYKHVVQSVEKFIQKCKPEYKIPGLYVIDSIVKQSRHQFGPDKDVFAPRFAKNAQITFYHLYKCSEEEKSKVIRVVNLWQKNNVFHSDAIQPLFDMANPQSEIFKNLDQQMKTTGKIVVAGTTPVKEEQREAKKERSESGRDNGGIDGAALKQLQTIQQFLKNHPPVQFNKKLLDFDHGSDDDSEGGGAGEPVLNQARRDRGRDRDRDRDRRDRDGDRRSGGRWEDRDDRRDRGRDDRGRDDRRGSSRFGRDEDRGHRRDSRWGRGDDRRDRDPQVRLNALSSCSQ